MTQNKTTEIKQIVVIGGSAGGLKAVTELVGTLPAGMPVALFIVIHLSKASSPENIRRHLQKNTGYPCIMPLDGEKIQNGCIYIAPQETHLFIKEECIRLIHGVHENRWRPSVDVLFRSAAAAYGSRVTGVVLSGLMDDGTSGMSAIRRSGGTCIVQEPQEAEFMDMPISVLSNMEVDNRVPVADIGYIIADNLHKPQPTLQQIPKEILIEAAITERMTSNIEDMKQIAEHSNYTWPDCGGGLWKINNEAPPRYRCHTGHVYSENILLEKQSEQLEESLWVCIRMMEERRNVLQNIGWKDKEAGDLGSSYRYQQKADDLNVHISRLKELLVTITKAEPDNDGYL